MFRIKRGLMVAIFLFTTSGSIALAGEHPSEHPAGEQSDVTTATISKAIEKHVKKSAKKNDGYFIVKDKEAGKMLYLKMDKIHKERLSAVKKDLYFACVDFTNKDGRSYDIDFFLKDASGKLRVKETNVHKEEGKPRYGWVQKGDFWVKKPVK